MQAVNSPNVQPEVSGGRNWTEILTSEKVLIGAHIFVAMFALSLGVLMGPFQAFRRAPGVTDLLGGNAIGMPIFSYYYQALTLHGVLNALVFTTFFIVGFSYFVTERSLQRKLRYPMLAWWTFVLMAVGLLLAAYAIISEQANVLFTFYAPMLAHWTFYLGLTLVIVGTWIASFNIFATYLAWKDEQQRPVPLAVFATLSNFVMWDVASLGVAIEVLTMLLPMSLGIIETTDVQVSRIFFWFFGHPLVYFWLIPAYTSWYTMLPKQLGVKLFSDSMGRVAFLMLMIFSIPIGVHHLFVDPGISVLSKAFHSALTFVVAIPSFLTAFNLAATLERAGRKRGGKGALFGLDFFAYLPWDDPVIVSQFGGMLLFLAGGITGVMNASFTLNIALHNTTWVVGHFHMTVAGAVFMTFMGILFWLLPVLTGRKLWGRKLALAHAYLWLFGMLLFGAAMGRAGVLGAVRRSDLGGNGSLILPEWVSWLNISAFAGLLLLISSILLYVVVIGTIFLGEKVNSEDELDVPISTSAPEGELLPPILEKWGLWLAVIIISCIIMWGPVLLNALDWSKGFWGVGLPPGISP